MTNHLLPEGAAKNKRGAEKSKNGYIIQILHFHHQWILHLCHMCILHMLKVDVDRMILYTCYLNVHFCAIAQCSPNAKYDS